MKAGKRKCEKKICRCKNVKLVKFVFFVLNNQHEALEMSLYSLVHKHKEEDNNVLEERKQTKVDALVCSEVPFLVNDLFTGDQTGVPRLLQGTAQYRWPYLPLDGTSCGAHVAYIAAALSILVGIYLPVRSPPVS